MMKPLRVCKDIYMVGSSELTHPYDCCIYLIDAGELILVDTGAGKSFEQIVANIKSLDLNIEKLKTVIVTHAHIDHMGALHKFQESFNVRIIAHRLDTTAIESGIGVGAEYYGVNYSACHVDVKIAVPEMLLQFGNYELGVVHIPGHTPGSIVVYMNVDGKRILFGQDIHGPYNRAWRADPVITRISLQKLIDLKADILCEGHFGVFQPASAVEEYIREYLDSL